MTRPIGPFPCACCGYLVHRHAAGGYDLCPICGWEDDAVQLEFATSCAGGANASTLFDAQRNFMTFGACDARSVDSARPPTPLDRRDADWRPIDPARDVFEDWDNPSRRRPDEPNEGLYYWRPTFWRLSQPA